MLTKISGKRPFRKAGNTSNSEKIFKSIWFFVFSSFQCGAFYVIIIRCANRQQALLIQHAGNEWIMVNSYGRKTEMTDKGDTVK